MTHEPQHEPEHTSATGETANETGGLLTGQMLADYRLGALLGAGGMAEVYRALDPALDREVAVKVLLAPRASDAGYVARFREEARRVAALNHPHIVPIYAFGEERGLLYHVMPLVPETLRDRLKREGRLAPKEAVRLVLQVASALEAAHALGLVHRDVKPENILLTAEGDTLLTDFGIARDLASLRKTGTVPTLSATGLPVGTPEYMAPEQLRGDVVDQRADVYALGAVLYELLTGKVPFEDETPYSVAVLVLTASLLPPSTLNPGVWPTLEQAVLTALARDPDARYPDMHRFAQALHEALDQPHPLAGAEDTTVPVGLVPVDALALGPSDQVTTPGNIWSATTWPRGADGAGEVPGRRLPQSPPWRKPAPRAGLVLLLLVGLAAGGALVVRGGAQSPSSIGSRPTPSVTTGPVATTTPAKPTATTTATATTVAAAATATATATPAPTLTLAPTPLVLTPEPQNTSMCAATQTITNNTRQTVGWTWQPPKQGGMHFSVNSGPWVDWPSDTPPNMKGIAPGGHDTLVATANCNPSFSFAVLMTTTLGDQYTFIVQV